MTDQSTPPLILEQHVLRADFYIFLFIFFFASSIPIFLFVQRRNDTTKEQKQAIEARQLEELITTLHQEVDLDTVMNLILETCSKSIPQAQKGFFWLFNHEKGHFSCAAVQGYQKEELANFSISYDELMHRYTHNTEEIANGVFVIRSFSKLSVWDHMALGIKSMLSMTIVINGRLEGFIGWDNFESERAFDHVAPEFVSRYRAHAVSAISKALMTQTLEDKNRRLLETKDQLIESEKMASLGQMVAGMAHEINTPVGIGVSAASHLVDITEEMIHAFQERKANKRDMEQYFEKAIQSSELIFKNLKRTSELMKSFKMVAADQTSDQQRIFKVRPYLEDITISLKPKLRKHQVSIQGDPDLEMNSYPGALFQIITNLVMNSLHHGFDPNDSSTGTIHIKVEAQDQWIMLSYQDNGRGIPTEDLDKIFDPFFTRASHSGGTGLGLNIVYNLVNTTLKGRIVCSSPPNEGALFQLKLPRHMTQEEASHE